MQIVNSPGTKKLEPLISVQAGSKPEKTPVETPSDDSGRKDLYVAGSGLAGGLTLGAGGAYVGLKAGIQYGLSMGDALGGHPLAKLAGTLLLGLPLAVAYGAIGAATGAAIGGAGGVAVGATIGHLATRD